MRGASLSIIHGNGENAYPAFVVHVRISNDEMLELMTAPSSVVFMSNTIIHHVMVVNSRYVDRMFCVVENKKFAAVRTEDHEPPGLTQ